MTISERVIPQMQNGIETVMARQSEFVPTMSKSSYRSGNDERNCDEDNMTNRNFLSNQNLTEPQEESHYSNLLVIVWICKDL